jgi:hypothetical protein
VHYSSLIALQVSRLNLAEAELLNNSLEPELKEVERAVLQQTKSSIAEGDDDFRPDAVFDDEDDLEEDDDEDVEEEVQEDEGSKRRKQFCIYCKTHQAKLFRHFQRKHRNETDVQNLLPLAPDSAGKFGWLF